MPPLHSTSSAEVPSPCISVCRMDPVRQLCEGCLRTIDEIAHWSSMSAVQKRAVLGAIAQRRRTADATAFPRVDPTA